MNNRETNPENSQENSRESEPAIPLWKLERYLLRELPPAELERIDKLKTLDPDLAGWLRALDAEHADLQSAHPTGHMAGRIWNKLKDGDKARKNFARRSGSSNGRGAWLRPGFLVPAFGMVLLSALVVSPLRNIGEENSGSGAVVRNPETTRLKGSLPELHLYRKSAQGPENLTTGAPARPGDLIQVFYDAAGKKYGAIYSVDGRGGVSWHLPEGGRLSVALKAAGRTPLRSAFELDGTAGEERFFFITSDRPFSLDSIPSAPPAGATTTSAFTLIKETGK